MKDPKKDSGSMDEELIRRCALGEEQAFEELVERMEKPLIHFILRYLGDWSAAEDLFQETMLRVVRNIREFRPQASLQTWIFTIARNLCLDRLKSRKRRKEVSLDAPQKAPGGKVIDFREVLRERASGPEARAAGGEQEAEVQRGLGLLAARKREVLILRVFLGLSYEEVARVVGSPVGTVKFRVHEAVRELGERMTERSAETG